VKDLFLVDQFEQKVISKYRDPEEAVKWLGAYMSLVTPEQCVGRFVLVHKPLKSGKSLIEYGADELFRRALVYVNHTILTKRRQKTEIGKWAR
jgi:hypothetical protein